MYKADRTFKYFAAFSALLILLLMGGIFIELLRLSLPAFSKFGLGFLVTEKWDPVAGVYGGISSITGTLLSTAIAMVIAVPLSLVIALFLVEIANPVIGKIAGYGIEMLAAIPSIVYGMWGLFVFAPFMSTYVQPFIQKYLGFLPFFSGSCMGIGMLTAGLILALMILPFITAVMRDVFKMVPPVMKEAAYGIGATTIEVARGVTLRYGLKGLIGASFLGLGRAIGETMAITFVIGNDHKISASLFAAGNTIASTLANEFTEASDPLHRSSLIALGFILFLFTLGIQIVSQYWIGRLYGVKK